MHTVTLHLESRRIERLVGLCKLWNAIKYFHPYLAYKDAIDWDAALVAAIPAINVAKNAHEYVVAVQSMLQALGDPTTSVQQQGPAETPAASHDQQPTSTFMPSNTLVVTINHYQDLLDYNGAQERMAVIKNQIPNARALLFDLRGNAPLSQERGFMALLFLWSDIATLLSSTPLSTPSQRFRMHTGFVPQTGITSGGYASAWRVVDGRRIEPSPEAKDIPTVFLINTWSELPPEAIALQMAGKAAIIVDGSASDASLVMTHQVPLSEEIIAEMRLGEGMCANGAGGLVPDIVVPPTQTVGGEDHALTTALALLNDFKPSTMVGVPLPAYVVPRSEKPYREMVFPALEYRLLAAFRIWGVINYFFPYKHLIEEDWDGVLREFIPRMEQAASALEYHRTVAEMVTHIHDSHGNIESPVLKEHVGTAGPPVRLQMIENTPVVTTLLDNEVPQTAGVTRGDSILAIDGEDIRDRMNRLEKYRAHSTPHRQKYWAAFASLLGPADSLVRLTVRDKHNQVKEVTLRRKLEYGTGNINQRNRDVIAFLSEDIGYADLDRLNVSQVDEMFETLKNTQAIIFDMRGYPNGTAWEIAPRLSERHDVEAALYHCPVVMTPDGRNGELARQSVSYSFVQVLPRTEKWRYQGKTVMLIDERTQSQAEHTGLFLKAANGTTFVGSPTAGANGDVTNFQVPAGITISFSGQSVSHIDGRQLQRIGLVPDIEVKPTIKGMQSGRDEVLESAVQYLQSEIEKDRIKLGTA